MKRKIHTIAGVLGALALLGLPACVGNAPGGEGGGEGADAGGEVDQPDGGGEVPLQISVTGMVYDYQEAMADSIGDPLAGAEVSTRGIDPAKNAIAGVEGDYALDNMPPGSVLYLDADPGEMLGYRPTVNEMVTIGEESVEVDLYLMSEIHVGQHYASTQDDPVVGTSIVIVDLYRNNGDPFVDVPLADVTLTDALGEPILGVAGPYFIGAGAVMDPEILVSTLAMGKARVGFLNVPPGDHKFNLAYIDNQEQPKTMTVDVMALADAATLQRTGGMGGGGGGGGGGGDGPVTFVKDIHPMLQRASQGGLSCATCHTGLHALPFDLSPAEVYELVTAIPAEGELAVINLDVPVDSQLLSRPLYETPANHPNATFANELNPTYISWMQWITDGALYE